MSHTEQIQTIQARLAKQRRINFLVVFFSAIMWSGLLAGVGYVYFTNKNTIDSVVSGKNYQQTMLEISKLNGHIGTLQTELDSYKSRPISIAHNVTPVNSPKPEQNFAPKIEELRVKITNLEDLIGRIDTDRKAHNLIVAAIELKNAVSASQDFKKELFALETIAGDNGNLSDDLLILRNIGNSNLPSSTAINESFASASYKAITHYRVNKPEQTTLDKASLILSKIVTIRKVDGDLASSNVEDVIARTSKYIDSGELATAISTLQILEPEYRTFFKAWIGDAKRLVAAEESVQRIYANILEN